MFTKTVMLIVAGAALSACSLNPRDYETTPVVLETAAGPVTCQLYRHDQVTWDRSISRPNSMDVKSADDLCRQEGYRVMKAGE